MFNLDRAILDWRKAMTAGGVASPEVLAELESHLRDDVEKQMQAGAEAPAAFATAVKRIGSAIALEGEFKKVGGWREIGPHLKRAMQGFAGVPNHYLDNNMNETSNLALNFEARWVTYLKAAAYAGPAICLWAFLSVFVLPKLKELLGRDANSALPSFFFLPLYITDWVRNHLALIVTSVALIVIALELRSTRWPRYRRAAVGIGAYTINVLVLVIICTLVLLATVVANDLLQRGR